MPRIKEYPQKAGIQDSDAMIVEGSVTNHCTVGQLVQHMADSQFVDDIKQDIINTNDDLTAISIGLSQEIRQSSQAAATALNEQASRLDGKINEHVTNTDNTIDGVVQTVNTNHSNTTKAINQLALDTVYAIEEEQSTRYQQDSLLDRKIDATATAIRNEASQQKTSLEGKIQEANAATNKALETTNAEVAKKANKTEVDESIRQQKEAIDSLVLHAGNPEASSAEIVQARNGKDTLNDRITENETKTRQLERTIAILKERKNVADVLMMQGVFWEKKTLNVNGGIVQSDNNILSTIFYVKFGDVITIDDGFSFIISSYDFLGNNGKTTGWMASEYVFASDGLIRVSIKNNLGDVVDVNEFNVIKITRNSLSLFNLNIINNSNIISEYSKQKMAHCGILDYDRVNKGIFYLCHYANDLTTDEGITHSSIYTTLRKFNVSDLNNKETLLTIKAGDTIGGFTQDSTYPPYDPFLFITNSGVAKIIFCGYDGVRYPLVCAKYDTTNKTLLNNSVVCKVTYSNTVYDLTTDNLRIIARANGKTIPDTDTGGYVTMVGNYVEYNNEYYCMVGMYGNKTTVNGFSGIMLKTTDFENFDFVSIPTYSFNCLSEISMAIKDNIAICVCRDLGNGIYVMNYDIIQNKWLNIRRLFNSVVSKPSTVVFNGSTFIAYNSKGMQNVGIDSRTSLTIEKININNLEPENYITFRYSQGIHYPYLVNYYDQCYMTFSTDIRNCNPSLKRGEIRFCEITDVLEKL